MMDTCIGGDGTSHVENVSCSPGRGVGVTATISIPKTNVYFDVVIKIKLLANSNTFRFSKEVV